MSAIVYAAGRFGPSESAAVSVFDHGLLYGDGIFEGIRAYNGRVFKLERHVERLFDSAKAIRLDIPMSRDEMAELVLEACRRNEIVDGYIRLVVTRGAGDLGIDPRSCPRADVIIIAKPVEALYGHARRRGATLVTSTFRRHAPDVLSPSIKSLNYLNNILARIEANDRGADEALMLDQNGFVSEATVDNIFIVVDRTLMTPPTATNLKGITRETVLDLAADLGIRTEERPFTLFDVWTAREAFMCGTMAEIVPVASVDGRTIGASAPVSEELPGRSGPLGAMTSRIADAYDRAVRSSGTPIHRPAPAGVEKLLGV
ncbi:MAG TPA: branched-chain-amino-acid transaminase [Vicinamibacterales bacterium]|jgi:branched-chain amino acid aminotransferase|nr:branched-chain-amino-acid transaminase [Vicinamibacterales bacterium]